MPISNSRKLIFFKTLVNWQGFFDGGIGRLSIFVIKAIAYYQLSTQIKMSTNFDKFVTISNLAHKSLGKRIS